MALTAPFAYLQVDPANRSERINLSDFCHIMCASHHDMATMTVPYTDDTDFTRWSTGVPLTITYGRGMSKETFYGYVLNVSTVRDKADQQPVTQKPLMVTAIGASYPLKAPLATIYKGLTASQMAFSLSRANYFDADIPPTTYTWPAKSSAGCSQWSFLTDLADREGLTMYMHGTQLRMYDSLTPLHRNDSAVPIFYAGSTIINFESDITEVSSTDGRRKRNRIVLGMDQLTGQAIYASDGPDTGSLALRTLAPAFDEPVTDLVTVSQAAATALLPARSSANRFPIRATATFVGDSRVTQESPLVLEGLGQRDSGIWQAIEVTQHVTAPNLFVTEAVLGRDSDYDNGVRPGLPADIARAHLDPYANVVFNRPPTVLVNQRWRAAWAVSAQAPGVT